MTNGVSADLVAPQVTAKPVHRVMGLDILRACAVMMVVLYHLPKPRSGVWLRALSHFGWIGVDLFFVLSGYLIGGQLFSLIVKEQSLSIPVFYARRFLRTLPNYYVVLTLSTLSLIYSRPLNAVHVGRFLVFAQNFGIPPMFTVSWSLCVEEHFYLFFPVLVFAVARLGMPRFTRLLFPTVVLAGILLRGWLWFHDLSNHVSSADGRWEVYLGNFYYPTYTRLDGLTLGVGLAALRYFEPIKWKGFVKHGNALLFSGAVLLAATLTVLSNPFSLSSCVFSFPMLALSFALITASSVSAHSWLGKLKLPGSGQIAMLSYAIYLTHLPAIALASWLASRLGWGDIVASMLSLLTIFFLATILYYGVERPFLELRDRLFSVKCRRSDSRTLQVAA